MATEPALYQEFRHHNYTEMEALLKKIVKIRPEIARLYSIGKSVRGRELYVCLFLFGSVYTSVLLLYVFLYYRYWSYPTIQENTNQANPSSNTSLICRSLLVFSLFFSFFLSHE